MSSPNPPPTSPSSTIEHCPTCRSADPTAVHDIAVRLELIEEMLNAIGLHLGAAGFYEADEESPAGWDAETS